MHLGFISGIFQLAYDLNGGRGRLRFTKDTTNGDAVKIVIQRDSDYA